MDLWSCIVHDLCDACPGPPRPGSLRRLFTRAKSPTNEFIHKVGWRIVPPELAWRPTGRRAIPCGTGVEDHPCTVTHR
jgi:hypothetical protein